MIVVPYHLSRVDYCCTHLIILQNSASKQESRQRQLGSIEQTRRSTYVLGLCCVLCRLLPCVSSFVFVETNTPIFSHFLSPQSFRCGPGFSSKPRHPSSSCSLPCTPTRPRFNGKVIRLRIELDLHGQEATLNTYVTAVDYPQASMYLAVGPFPYLLHFFVATYCSCSPVPGRQTYCCRSSTCISWGIHVILAVDSRQYVV